MSIVVLHGNQRNRQVCSQLSRETGRAIVRVEIAGDGPWCDMKQLLEILDRLSEGPVCFQSRKITEMLAEHRTRLPVRRATVFLRCPPTARIGPCAVPSVASSFQRMA